MFIYLISKLLHTGQNKRTNKRELETILQSLREILTLLSQEKIDQLNKSSVQLWMIWTMLTINLSPLTFIETYSSKEVTTSKRHMEYSKRETRFWAVKQVSINFKGFKLNRICSSSMMELLNMNKNNVTWKTLNSWKLKTYLRNNTWVREKNSKDITIHILNMNTWKHNISVFVGCS